MKLSGELLISALSTRACYVQQLLRSALQSAYANGSRFCLAAGLADVCSVGLACGAFRHQLAQLSWGAVESLCLDHSRQPTGMWCHAGFVAQQHAAKSSVAARSAKCIITLNGWVGESVSE